VKLTPDIATEFSLVLDNMNLARLLAKKILKDVPRGLNFSAFIILLNSEGRVELPGKNHGFFSTPVIHNAMIDISRVLEFFRIGFSKGELKELGKPKYPDDLTILDFEKPPLRIADVVSLSVSVCGRAPTNSLHQIEMYRNKELAHFTKTPATPDLAAIVDATTLGMELLLVHLFDALGERRPKIQPSNSRV